MVSECHRRMATGLTSRPESRSRHVTGCLASGVRSLTSRGVGTCSLMGLMVYAGLVLGNWSNKMIYWAELSPVAHGWSVWHMAGALSCTTLPPLQTSRHHGLSSTPWPGKLGTAERSGLICGCGCGAEPCGAQRWALMSELSIPFSQHPLLTCNTVRYV